MSGRWTLMNMYTVSVSKHATHCSSSEHSCVEAGRRKESTPINKFAIVIDNLFTSWFQTAASANFKKIPESPVVIRVSFWNYSVDHRKTGHYARLPKSAVVCQAHLVLLFSHERVLQNKYIRVHDLLKSLTRILLSPPQLILSQLTEQVNLSLYYEAKILRLFPLFSPNVQPLWHGSFYTCPYGLKWIVSTSTYCQPSI